jgi:hypothetical protein
MNRSKGTTTNTVSRVYEVRLQGSAGDCGDSRVRKKSLETRINTGYNDASGSSSFYLLEMA